MKKLMIIYIQKIRREKLIVINSTRKQETKNRNLRGRKEKQIRKKSLEKIFSKIGIEKKKKEKE
jgi:hypothetical protein